MAKASGKRGSKAADGADGGAGDSGDNELIRKNVMLRKGDWQQFKRLPAPGRFDQAEYEAGKEGRVVSYHIRQAMHYYLRLMEVEGYLKDL